MPISLFHCGRRHQRVGRTALFYIVNDVTDQDLFEPDWDEVARSAVSVI